MSYAMTVRVAAAFAPTVERICTALREQGFGVLTEIDMRAALHAKLGVDRTVGLLLPCNVVIRTGSPDTTVVEALDPQIMVRTPGQGQVPGRASAAGSAGCRSPDRRSRYCGTIRPSR